MSRRNRRDRRARLAHTWQGVHRGLRGRGGLITFLATAGVLGILSGFALASPQQQTAVTATDSGHTTVTGDTTTSEMTTITLPDTTSTVTGPNTTSTITGPDTTSTLTEPDTTSTVTDPDTTT